MCGIFAVFGHSGPIETFRPKAVSLSKRIRHRGPDWSGIAVIDNNVLCHERLAIVGVDSGAQPLRNGDETVFLCVNGEIYNHKSLRLNLEEKRMTEGKPVPVYRTASDCEIILHLYEEYGVSCVSYLDGMFAFVLYDSVNQRYIAARDPIGIVPLYQGWSADGSVWFASEMKCIFEDCSQKLVSFEPGTIYDSMLGKSERWYEPTWWSEWFLPKSSDSIQHAIGSGDRDTRNTVVQFDNLWLDKIRNALIDSVEKMLMSEVPYGVLLSGGLDSSLIAAIAARCTIKSAQDLNKIDSPSSPVTSPGFWSQKLHSFSVGLPGSPDLVAARKVAQHIGTLHHEFTFTIDEGLDAMHEVIYHLESYDVTTIRASTPMYLMSRKIKASGVKMVLSGEGSDEVFGGYLYFHQAPSVEELHKETLARVKLLHTSDCLRANKSTMAWGVEARVPFLDTHLLDIAMTMPPEYKHPKLTPRMIEKEILRKAFDVDVVDESGTSKPYLPEDVLWRQKEQFSDGVGYSWIDKLKSHAEALVSDENWNNRFALFPFDTPATREAFCYRRIFEGFFCPPTAEFSENEYKKPILETVVRWVPRKDWGCNEDPSGRAQNTHINAYE